MEKFRVQIKNRLKGLWLFLIALVVAVLVSNLYLANFSDESKMLSFITGFILGLSVVGFVLSIRFIFSYTSALKNDVKLKKLFIYETDERTCEIEHKANSSAFSFIIYTFMLATIVSGYVNAIVCFTLLAVLFFLCIVKVAFKLYYSKKL